MSSCKIIYLCVNNLFVTPNYLFALSNKLFHRVDSFVRDISFLLFILYNQMFAMCNILFIVYYYLFAMFNSLFVENKYLFVLLKYLFVVAEINYWVLKKYFLKISCKYRQLWSCFEDLVIGNLMIQFKFNLDTRFKNYNFFEVLNFLACVMTSSVLSFLHICTSYSLS